MCARRIAVVLAEWVLLGACGSDPGWPSESQSSAEEVRCEVAIVGGGPGGLHTAFRLAPEMGSGVCLFEKEAELGGRIHDVALDEGDPRSPRFGAGARRVMRDQAVPLALAAELGLELESAPPGATLINARHAFAGTKNALVSRYPGVPRPADPAADVESWLYDQLLAGPERARAAEYPDFRDYVRAVVGDEGYDYLHDMTRFRADFEYPLDTRGYLRYLDEEWALGPASLFPVGGMSSFIRGMQARASEAGARLFESEPVLAVQSREGGYELVTSRRTVLASRLVIAVPPSALAHIQGDVPERLLAQGPMQELIGVRVVTVTQWWPRAWWEELRVVGAPADRHLAYAWTTHQCLNAMIFPQEPYAVQQNVTRSVSDDDLACVQFWEALAEQGTPAVEAEIERELLALFLDNGVTTPARVEIPEPIKTHVQIWPAAWHWLRAGATSTNADIFEWATEPLPGEEIGLVGEAYDPQRSGWSDAAYKSSIHLLNARYGMDLPGLDPSGAP